MRPRLPDGPVRPLDDALLSLPSAPPELLSPDSGVEGLPSTLSAGEDMPTYVPGSRLDELLEEQSTTLYSDTDAGGAPQERPQRARRSIEELSAEAPPSGGDPSTMDRAPLYLESRPGPGSGQVIILPTGSVSAVELHTTEPAAVRRSVHALGLIGPLLLTPVVLLLCLSGSVVGYGVIDKLFASVGRDRAGLALVQTVEEQHSLIEALTEAGADRERLETSWFQVQDATPEERPGAAAAFVSVVLEESEQVELGNIGQIQVAQLHSSRSEWAEAADALEATRRSWPARLSGDLGL